MSTTFVLYVHRRDAKTIKSHLEAHHYLDKRYRMVPTSTDAIIHNRSGDDGNDEDIRAQVLSGQCIAVPLLHLCIEKLHEYSWAKQIVGTGMHHCPFSTSMGNSNRIPAAAQDESNTTSSTQSDQSLNDVQHALVETLVKYCSEAEGNFTEIQTEGTCSCTRRADIVKLVQSLSAQTCPKKLEVIGDDRTLVVPRWSFYIPSSNDCETIAEKRKIAEEFYQLLIQCNLPGRYERENSHNMQSLLWENLARTHRSLRVVRRGDIDPESGVRESG